MKGICLVVFMSLAVHVFAANDSLVVVNAKWQVRKLDKGVWLSTCHFRDSSLFMSNQNISILEVRQNRKLRLTLGVEASLRKTTSAFGVENKALAALNGTFFDMSKGGSVLYIRKDGKTFNKSILNSRNNAAIVIDKKRLKLQVSNGVVDWEEQLKGEDIMVSGPALLIGSNEVSLDSNTFNLTRHPRTIIATGNRKRVYFITVDGRHANSAGMSLFEARSVLRWIRLKNAINLDGGGSTTLWTSSTGVVNYPSDNKKWDHKGERPVANVILLKKK